MESSQKIKKLFTCGSVGISPDLSALTRYKGHKRLPVFYTTLCLSVFYLHLNIYFFIYIINKVLILILQITFQVQQ